MEKSGHLAVQHRRDRYQITLELSDSEQELQRTKCEAEGSNHGGSVELR